jgi:Zn ribbon nucleic-acid-binding protein
MRRKDARQDLIVYNKRQSEWGLCAIVETDEVALVEELFNKHSRHYVPYGALKVITTKSVDEIPLIDCPACKTENVPLSYRCTMVKGDKTIDIYECAKCGKVPNVSQDVEIKKVVKL